MGCGCSDGRVLIWDAGAGPGAPSCVLLHDVAITASGGCGTPASKKPDPVMALCHLPDGRLATAGTSIKIWTLPSVTEAKTTTPGQPATTVKSKCDVEFGVKEMLVQTMSLLAIINNRDGTYMIASGDDDGVARLWSSTGSLLGVLGKSNESPPIWRLEIFPFGLIAAHHADDSMTVWDIDSHDRKSVGVNEKGDLIQISRSDEAVALTAMRHHYDLMLSEKMREAISSFKPKFEAEMKKIKLKASEAVAKEKAVFEKLLKEQVTKATKSAADCGKAKQSLAAANASLAAAVTDKEEAEVALVTMHEQYEAEKAKAADLASRVASGEAAKVALATAEVLLDETMREMKQCTEELASLRAWKAEVLLRCPGVKESIARASAPAAVSETPSPAHAASASHGKADDTPPTQHLECDVCLEDKSTFVALGCHFKLKPGHKIVCRGYVCKDCSSSLKNRVCPWCSEECLPVEKRPIINILTRSS